MQSRKAEFPENNTAKCCRMQHQTNRYKQSNFYCKTGKGNAAYNYEICLSLHHHGLHEHFAARQKAFSLAQPLRRSWFVEWQRTWNYRRSESKVPQTQQTLVSHRKVNLKTVINDFWQASDRVGGQHHHQSEKRRKNSRRFRGEDNHRRVEQIPRAMRSSHRIRHHLDSPRVHASGDNRGVLVFPGGSGE